YKVSIEGKDYTPQQISAMILQYIKVADVLQTVTYTRTATVDAVDRTVLSYGNWTTNVNSYPAIESPTITGYTADQTTI
ncbi:hypothetical protein NL503_29665, partial [Klebsiella pneumoniae]|nr:hypothetical protein [Klebsiella pneumoniae]